MLFRSSGCRRHQSRHYASGLAAVALLAAVLPAWSQTQVPNVFRPDAGTILNLFTPPVEQLVLPATGLPKPSNDMPTTADSDARIRVYGFELEGVSLLPAAEVEAQLAALIGQEASLGDLRLAAARVTALYRERGFFLARAYVPAQQINGGSVRIAVLEGRYDQVEASGSARLRGDRAARTLAAHGVVAGQPVEQRGLERSLILLEQRVGTPATALLQPGSSVGTSNLQLAVPPGPLATGAFGVDNFGSRYTGQTRGIASLRLNSPLGIGDRADVSLAYSSGASAAFAAYHLPVGHDGLTVGASYSYFSYDLCCEFAALEREGDASVVGLQVRYPLLLSQSSMIHVGLGLERTDLHDTWAGGDLADRQLDAMVFSLDGITAGRAGQLSYWLALTSGDLEIKGPADFAASDAETLNSAGGFSKLWGQADVRVPTGSRSFLNLRLSGQLANRNLDSSEKFLLGGYNGVRAYPEGEAAADDALLARLEWVRPLNLSAMPGQAAVRAFVDSGAVQIVADRRGGRADPGIPNNYSLHGAGLGFNWNLPRGLSLSAYVATTIGDNPGRSAAGNDADGEDNSTRGWVGAQWAF
jgi:hemolysin activation/secretion protein